MLNFKPIINLQDPVTLFFVLFYAVLIVVLLWLSYSLFQSYREKKRTKQLESKMPIFSITSKDITAIAGDDKLDTQLDLARAYIETGRKQLAKKILDDVLMRGIESHRQEAQRLSQLL